MTESLDYIDPMNENVLRSYRGAIPAKGGPGIEFPTMHHATSWAQVCGVEAAVRLRADMQSPTFGEPVVVLITTLDTLRRDQSR